MSEPERKPKKRGPKPDPRALSRKNLNLRIGERTHEQLQELATHYNAPQSEIVRSLIVTAWERLPAGSRTTDAQG